VEVLLIFDVHWTSLFSSFYKLNVDATSPIEGGKWGIDVVVIDNEGVAVAHKSFYYQIQRLQKF
jgi:hypothetical protein